MASTNALLIAYRVDVGPTVSETMNKQRICAHDTDLGVINIMSLQPLGSEAIKQATRFEIKCVFSDRCTTSEIVN